MSSKPFTHLHTHSHYSLLQALPQIQPLVAAAKADGQKALALTDAGALYGAVEFYQECKKNEIKPIIGVDAYVAARTRHDKEHRIDNRSARVVLLAKNTVGYHNLIKLVSKSYTEGFYYNPRIDRELLEEHHEGIIALIPSFAGETARAIKEEDSARAHESLTWYRDLFGEDCYQEITMHPEIADHQKIQEKLIALAKELNVPLAAAHDTYYLNPEDALARELVVKIKTGERLDRDMGVREGDFSFITQKRAGELFKDLPEALENTQQIVDKCDLDLTLGEWVFAHYEIPKGSTHDEELRKQAYAGFEERSIKETPELRERLDYELGVIADKGYSGYFLVVADLLAYAKETGIFTNTRGSAAGSFVSFLCGITTVDPIAFNMPFERFLNPERPSPPDIDMDIADNRRDDLIDYARKKYGTDNVVQIGTFGTMLARAAVRDVARALGHSYNTGDMIAKLIPPPKQGFPVFIENALKDVPELKEVYNSDPDAREILDLAQKVEGNARHVGVHAAGVFITPKPIIEYVPIQFDPKGGKMITQYDMYSAGEDGLGLLKFDFLGLKNLSVLADSVERTKERKGVVVDMEKLPIDDKNTYEMLARGETLGVFQFASSGMTNYLVELKPTRIDDLNAMVALYRPGPMAFIPDYIERKHNPSLVKYLDPRLEPILNRTYGILIYQDDLLIIASELAGYTMGEADKFRKAVGKKIPEEMAKQKDRFLSGCIERGMSSDIAQKLWNQIETFAAYGFNKAHAASYGNLAYQTAYMKANHTVDYMAALLTGEEGDVEKIAATVAECGRLGITVLPPHINDSYGDFTVVDEKTIRFGLYSIKNFGQGISDSIIAEREKNGKYKDLGDFLSRVRERSLNRKSLEALLQCGALGDFVERGRALTHIDMLLAYHKEHMNVDANQVSLFGALPSDPTPLTIPDAPAASTKQLLQWEKELLGLYISGHPLDPYMETLKKQKFDIVGTKEKMQEGITTVVGGMLETVQFILTKNGDKMAFGRLADHSGSVEVVAFPRILKEHELIFKPDCCVLIKGKMSTRGSEKSFVAEAIKELK